MRYLILIFVLTWDVIGSTFYVRTDGSNSNDGLSNASGGAWLTIGYAESQMQAGDVIRVQTGTYNERVAVAGVSGTSDDWITFVADGQVVCRGFDLTGVSYIRLVGFEITHNTLDYQRGITMAGTCANIQIIDNYIHNVYRDGIVAASTGSAVSYVTIRGNTFEYIGQVPGVNTNAACVGIGSAYITPHHWLVEYNTISKAPDFVNVFGTNVIVRNNYLHDFQNAYWNTTDAAWHSDMFQTGSDGAVVGTRHQVYERNFTGDSTEAHSHFALWQDTVSAGDTNILVRGNVAFNFGSGGVGVIGVDKVSIYNNTFYKLCQISPGAISIFYKGGSSATNYTYDNLVANTLIYDRGLSTDALVLGSGADPSTATFTHNLGYISGAESSYVSTSDPLLVDVSTKSFRLQAGSPAIDAGTNLVSITSADGSGTSFDVNDGQLLIDGWGLVDGDTVTVGATTTRITGISENTVTVADSVTWTEGDPVSWGTDTSPDIGAFPYGSAELTAASIIRAEDTYTVNVTGDARGVWFYVDGIPTTWDATPPYAATIASGTVTAKAYALYAQETPVVSAAFSTLSGGKASGSVIATGGAIVR